MDSFFEYALKSHILLSEGYPPEFNASGPFHEYDNYFLPLPYQAHSPDSFLKVWEESFEAIKTNLYRGSSYQYPHYIQGDITTGATRALWMDSLSAYFPGLLTLAGNVEEAAETHLLNTALWTRFSALPERWNVATGDIEGGLEWWGGRPEFIESTYYLYRATEDPWYLYVGEMVLRDIKRRCWTKCGWAGLQNVRRGDQSDRMESFFLGETSKYLYLLFEPSHPLNKIDSPYVYSTEGHPLVLPAKAKQTTPPRLQQEWKQHKNASVGTCGPPAVRNPFGVSSTAARPDIFHAASLARLRLTPPKTQPESPIVEFSVDGPSVTLSDLGSPSNYTYFPWTLPPSLVPRDAVSSPMAVRPTLDLTFPPLSSTIQGPPSLERVEGGILIKSFGGLRLGMIQDAPLYSGNTISSKEGFRIQVVSNIPLGKNEKVFVSRETTSALSPTDPNFTQTPDTIMMDIIIDVKPDIVYRNNSSSSAASLTDQGTVVSGGPVLDSSTAKADDHAGKPESHKSALSSLLSHVTALIRDELQHLPSVTPPIFRRPIARFSIPAISSTGIGSAPLPGEEDATFTPPSPGSKHAMTRLSWSSIYLAGHLCDKRLPPSIPQTHQIIVVKRGDCTFSDKLRNIPSFRPSRSSLQLVVVVSYPQPGEKRRQSAADEESSLIRPLLDEMQTVVGGFPRPRPISMVMVGGGEKTYEYFNHALGVGIRRRYEIQSQGIPISNLIVI
ncbi:uncharacterized protein ARB_04655 [Trichophyton benhamiae CBS 112371]|uniref:alpha-1,2-Mannosidase n=1 Tax=Arthroderma benhamiae (strain ATCC MYA-4681 / CBS 112371) TaxID=663331 RepID=D4AK54_ARTBC|nr:uncharacterized protein ARB_04655 [Trichophyton benhamiae CBS 112371]EFE37127.1 hypothetical protein ARB_04655 [Trichophyton benhamiae CBS 112371]